MVRKLFIVSPGQRALYESLKRSLAGEDNVEVIYDRRVARQEQRRTRSIWSEGPLADLGERRVRSDIDEALRRSGWAVVRIADDAPGHR